MSQPARGVLTFLFTDIEGSTRLLQEVPDDYGRLLADQRRIIAEAVAEAGGRVFGTEGDAVFASLSTAGAALAAAAAGQRRLAAHRWPGGVTVGIRMGVHAGEVSTAGDNYVGLPLHQVARVMSAAHGGQVIVTETARRLAEPLPAGLALRDLGDHRLKDLQRPERLYQLVGEGLADGFPAPRTLDARPNNLPLQLTSFIGRDELQAARQALSESHLLTLTGPGGTGKTRLALQLAAEVSDDFPDGVYFVSLEAVREPELLPSAVAAALGLADTPGVAPLTRLTDHLRGRHVLLVLDNFEQVVEGAPTIAELLRELPEARAVVTSRTVLRVYGEREFPVPPLGVPPSAVHGDVEPVTARSAASWEAVRLFVERAMSLQPAFRLTDENAGAIVEIVRQVDGLPLAIELAAARTRILSVEAIRSRLGQRLGLLTDGARDVPARQQTLRGAIDWSYELLDETERRLFERFSVFVGGAFLTQVEEVCVWVGDEHADVLGGLSRLAEKSLVRAGLSSDEDPRFVMLVTIREYALEKVQESGELAELELRHARAYLELAEGVADRLTGPEGRRWLDRLEHDHDNLRQALDWAVEHGQAEVALRLITAVWRFWQIRGHLYIAREQVERVTAMPTAADQPPALQARALVAAGGVCYWQGDFPSTHRYYARAVDQARRSGDKHAIAEALYNFGFASRPDIMVADYAESYAFGRPAWEESLKLYSELGETKGLADVNWALAMALAPEGDIEGAIRHVKHSLELYSSLDDAFGKAWAAHQLALYLVIGGRTDEAVGHLTEALRLFMAAGDQSGIQLALVDYAVISAKAGLNERSWRLGGAAEALGEVTGVGLNDAAASFVGWAPPSPPSDDPAGMRIWNEGRAMSIEDAVAFAIDQPPPA